MTDLLFDVHMAEVLTDNKIAPVPDEWRKGLDPDYFRDLSFQSVLMKHNVSEKNFYKSVGYYSKDLRLYTRIYTDVYNRYKTFSDEINDWKYHVPTAEEFYQNALFDTIMTRKLFYEQHFRPDTVEIAGYSIVPDSVISWRDLKTREWLSERNLEKEKFYVIDPKDYVIIPDNNASIDSVKGSENLLEKPDLKDEQKSEREKIEKTGVKVISF